MKTVSAKLYPTPTQELTLVRYLNVSRWVFNRALEQRIKAWKRRKQSISYYDQQSVLTQWRERMEWIRLVPAQIERDALRRVDDGMRAFFRRLKSGDTPGFPRFKSASRWRSFRVLQPGKYIRDGGRVYVPGIGPMRCRGLKEFSGTIRGVRVVRKIRGWYVQLIVDDGIAPSKVDINSSIGIDLGLTRFATLSNGRCIENQRWYRTAHNKVRFLERIVSRRKNGSNRQRKAVDRLARFHSKIADTRRDWLHKESRKIINEYDLIAVENLNFSGLLRSRFAKSILDAAWGEFVSQLEYKAENAGKTLILVNPRGTSQECSACGAESRKLLRDRVHKCHCGLTLDRDHNAALNILRRATAESTPVESSLAGGGAQSPPRRGSKKREVAATQFGEVHHFQT